VTVAANAESLRPGRRRRRRPPQDRDDTTVRGDSRIIPYLFSTPAIIMVAGLLGFPVLWGVYQSLFRSRIFGAPARWVGLDNYVDMFADPNFQSALGTTAVFVGGCIVIGTVLGLLFAFALNRVVTHLRFLRAVTVAPYIISNVAAAVMFKILFNTEFGHINIVLSWFGIEGLRWLSEPELAMLVVILCQVWTDLPLSILLLLGGLQTIDSSYLDAALVDGATGWQRARYLSIPLIAPQIAISVVWMSYSTLTGLGVVLALTGGGPLRATQTLPMEMYFTAFTELEMNEALAIATFLLVLNALLTLLFVRVSRRYDVAA
jgi:multiple sugar transport system permease protein